MSYQDKVRAEKSQLDERLGRLITFMYTTQFDTLDSVDQDLLRKQKNIMYEYSRVLEQRILRFKPPVEDGGQVARQAAGSEN